MNRTSVSFRSNSPEILVLFPEIQTHWNFEDFCSEIWDTPEQEQKFYKKNRKWFSTLMKNIGFTEQNIVDSMWTFYNPCTNQTYNHFNKKCDFKDAPLHLASNADTFIHTGMIIEKSYSKFFPKLLHFIGSGNSIYEPSQDDIDNYGEPVITSLFWENPCMLKSYTAYIQPNNFPYGSAKITADYIKSSFKVSHHNSLQEMSSYLEDSFKVVEIYQ